jgi:hypothetical protein
LFHRKASWEKKNSVMGNFCSIKCLSETKARICIGDANGNYRHRLYDADGYKIETPKASLGIGFGKIKSHHAAAFEILGIKKLPLGTHIHHRNCDPLDNRPENLQLILASDHKWLHKQFGSAGLMSAMNGTIEIEEISRWSDEPDRAYWLLIQDLNFQANVIRHIKDTTQVTDLGRVLAMKPIRPVFEVIEFNGANQ